MDQEEEDKGDEEDDFIVLMHALLLLFFVFVIEIFVLVFESVIADRFHNGRDSGEQVGQPLLRKLDACVNESAVPTGVLVVDSVTVEFKLFGNTGKPDNGDLGGGADERG